MYDKKDVKISITPKTNKLYFQLLNFLIGITDRLRIIYPVLTMKQILFFLHQRHFDTVFLFDFNIFFAVISQNWVHLTIFYGQQTCSYQQLCKSMTTLPTRFFNQCIDPEIALDENFISPNTFGFPIWYKMLAKELNMGTGNICCS